MTTLMAVRLASILVFFTYVAHYALAFTLHSRTHASSFKLQRSRRSLFARQSGRKADDTSMNNSIRETSRMDFNKAEKCVVCAVNQTTRAGRDVQHSLSFEESCSEMRDLAKTAGLDVCDIFSQQLAVPNPKTYIGGGKVAELAACLKRTAATTLVVDDDLSHKQQRGLEDELQEKGAQVKLLDRSAVILEIFAQHARTREGQLQVEQAMLEYRLTRGPKVRGDDLDRGCGFRGPGESKLETDRRIIRDKIVEVQRDLKDLAKQRQMRRANRGNLPAPLVALVGYTNAGKSSLLNWLCSSEQVLAENKLFATLDPTTRKVRLCISSSSSGNNAEGNSQFKGPEVLLTDTVGFISKLPANLLEAFRGTLEEVALADILVVVCDRSSPVWLKQRHTVYAELDRLGCRHVPIVELWNKVDLLDPSAKEAVHNEVTELPVDTDPFSILHANCTKANNSVNNDVANEDTISKTNGYADHGDDMSGMDEEYRYLTASDETGASKQPQLDSRSDVHSINNNRTLPRFHRVVAGSIRTREGMDTFVQSLSDAVGLFLTPLTLLVPYGQEHGVVDMVHRHGRVLETQYLSDGTWMSVEIPEQLVERLDSFVVKS